MLKYIASGLILSAYRRSFVFVFLFGLGFGLGVHRDQCFGPMA